MLTVIWFGWGFICAWAIRVAVVALLLRRFGSLSYLLAYLIWAALLALGILIVSVTGFQPYGFDPKDPWQVFGYAIFAYSPLGIPLVLGAPLVLVLDLLARSWRALVTLRTRLPTSRR